MTRPPRTLTSYLKGCVSYGALDYRLAPRYYAFELDPAYQASLECHGSALGFLARVKLWLSLLWGEPFSGFNISHIIRSASSGRRAGGINSRKTRPGRHRRRMIARRARGIRPVGRYTCCGLAPLIPNSPCSPLTRFQYLERCAKLAPMSRFHIYNWNYVSLGLRKSAINFTVVYLGLFAAHCVPLCAAPLKPD